MEEGHRAGETTINKVWNLEKEGAKLKIQTQERQKLLMQNLSQDIRFAFRIMLKSRGFTAVAVLTLALGIGANTAIFSVVNTVLLRPLPYKDADRLRMLWETNLQKQMKQSNVSGPNFMDWKSQNSTFDNMAAYRLQNLNLTNITPPERVRALLASATLFDVLKTNAALGRTFTDEEDTPGKNNVAVISNELWQRNFSADPNITGREIKLNNKSVTVIGVLPPDFAFPPDNQKADLWLPLALDAQNAARGSHQLQVIGRLKEGVTDKQAQAEMETIARRLEQQYPDTNVGWSVRHISLHENLVKNVKQFLYLLLGAVGFVLLIACTNVANLLLARSTSRQREMAIRVALGAGRGRLIRQLLTESILLSLFGSVLGLLLAYWTIDLLIAFSPQDIPRLNTVGIDLKVLAYTLFISLLTGLIFGLFPALQSSKQNLSEGLKERSGIMIASRYRRIRDLLVVSEMALTIVLLIGAGLLVKSLMHLQQVTLGFKADNLLTMQVALPDYNYPEEGQWANAFQQIIERVEHLPGVQSVGASSMLPLSTNNLIFDFTIEGQPSANSGIKTSANFRSVSDQYFSTMSIPLISGRQFTERDNVQAPKVIIINETMAKRFWPQDNPVGKRVTIGYGQPVLREIIGVVGDVKQAALDAQGQAEIYVPYIQTPLPFMGIVIRTTNDDPTRLMPAVRNQLLTVDKDLPIYSVKSMQNIVSDSLGQTRFRAALLAMFAIVALGLAIIGIYGVLSYLINERRHEIGIRMALGARPSDILKLVIRQGMALVLSGLFIGLLIAWFISPIVTSLLYGVSTTDPITLIMISLLLLATALLACYIPARKASKISPLTAIRSE